MASSAIFALAYYQCTILDFIQRAQGTEQDLYFIGMVIIFLHQGAGAMPFQTELFLSKKMKCCATLSDGKNCISFTKPSLLESLGFAILKFHADFILCMLALVVGLCTQWNKEVFYILEHCLIAYKKQVVGINQFLSREIELNK